MPAGFNRFARACWSTNRGANSVSVGTSFSELGGPLISRCCARAIPQRSAPVLELTGAFLRSRNRCPVGYTRRMSTSHPPPSYGLIVTLIATPPATARASGRASVASPPSARGGGDRDAERLAVGRERPRRTPRCAWSSGSPRFRRHSGAVAVLKGVQSPQVDELTAAAAALVQSQYCLDAHIGFLLKDVYRIEVWSETASVNASAARRNCQRDRFVHRIGEIASGSRSRITFALVSSRIRSRRESDTEWHLATPATQRERLVALTRAVYPPDTCR
jgi:hypothetical protein